MSLHGDVFDHIEPQAPAPKRAPAPVMWGGREIPGQLAERIRDEAQVLALAHDCPADVTDAEAALAAGFVRGAAMALGLTEDELLEACRAGW